MEKASDVLLSIINLGFEGRDSEHLFEDLRKTKVLLIHSAVEKVGGAVSLAFLKLYEKAIARSGSVRVVLLPRVGKKEFIDISPREDPEIRKEKILRHLFLKDNLYCITRKEGTPFPNWRAGDIPSRRDTLSTRCLFHDLEEEVEENLKRLTADIGFKWYLDWCSKELGEKENISGYVQEIRNLPTEKLMNLMVKLFELSKASEGTKFNSHIRQMRELISKVLRSRVQTGKRGRPSRREVNLVTEFPEVFEEGGFDLAVIDGTEIKATDLWRILRNSKESLKPSGDLFLILPRNFTYSEPYGEIRNFILGRARIISKVEEGIAVLAGRDQVQGMVFPSVGNRILTFENPKERSLIERIVQESRRRLSDIAVLMEGARLRRYTGKEGEERVIFPENIFNYRLSGPYRYLKKEERAERTLKKLKDILKPKVVMTRKVEVSSYPPGFLRFFCARDGEGSPISEGVLGIVPLTEEIGSRVILGLVSSLLFRWLMHRIAFDMDTATLKMSSEGVGILPVGNSLSDVAQEVSGLVSELEREFRRETFIELENLILRSYGLKIEEMPRSYRELYSSPDAVRF